MIDIEEIRNQLEKAKTRRKEVMKQPTGKWIKITERELKLRAIDTMIYVIKEILK